MPRSADAAELAQAFLATVPSTDLGLYKRFKSWAEWEELHEMLRLRVWRKVMDLRRGDLNAGVDSITGCSSEVEDG